MNNSGFQVKVGVFVAVGVSLLALLILNFSKGITFLNPTYNLRVVLPNAAGLKPTADVMMAGVPIGKVRSISLSDNAKAVNINVTILAKYKIRRDAAFRIDALGFLGDQYVSVTAPEGTGLAPPADADCYHNGDTVIGVPTFNMIEAVQSISGVVNEAKKTMRDVDQAVTNINNTALSTNTLARFVIAVNNLEIVSEKAVAAAGRAESLLDANGPPLSSSISNFQTLSVQLTNSAAQLEEIIVTNKADVREVVGNLTVASDQFKKIATDLEAGKGTAGSLLKDEQMRANVAGLVSNADSMMAEFSEFGHNLNQRGIWAMLWRPKHRDTNAAPSRR